VGNEEKEKEFIGQFDKFYELLQKSFKNTRSYQLNLIEVKRQIDRVDK
jgi:hypothetical protein